MVSVAGVEFWLHLPRSGATESSLKPVSVPGESLEGTPDRQSGPGQSETGRMPGPKSDGNPADVMVLVFCVLPTPSVMPNNVMPGLTRHPFLLCLAHGCDVLQFTWHGRMAQRGV